MAKKLSPEMLRVLRALLHGNRSATLQRSGVTGRIYFWHDRHLAEPPRIQTLNALVRRGYLREESHPLGRAFVLTDAGRAAIEAALAV